MANLLYGMVPGNTSPTADNIKLTIEPGSHVASAKEIHSDEKIKGEKNKTYADRAKSLVDYLSKKHPKENLNPNEIIKTGDNVEGTKLNISSKEYVLSKRIKDLLKKEFNTEEDAEYALEKYLSPKSKYNQFYKNTVNAADGYRSPSLDNQNNNNSPSNQAYDAQNGIPFFKRLRWKFDKARSGGLEGMIDDLSGDQENILDAELFENKKQDHEETDLGLIPKLGGKGKKEDKKEIKVPKSDLDRMRQLSIMEALWNAGSFLHNLGMQKEQPADVIRAKPPTLSLNTEALRRNYAQAITRSTNASRKKLRESGQYNPQTEAALHANELTAIDSYSTKLDMAEQEIKNKENTLAAEFDLKNASAVNAMNAQDAQLDLQYNKFKNAALSYNQKNFFAGLRQPYVDKYRIGQAANSRALSIYNLMASDPSFFVNNPGLSPITAEEWSIMSSSERQPYLDALNK